VKFLIQLAHWAETNCKDDMATLLSSGFQAAFFHKDENSARARDLLGRYAGCVEQPTPGERQDAGHHFRSHFRYEPKCPSGACRDVNQLYRLCPAGIAHGHLTLSPVIGRPADKPERF
jgi:hypothetical protein